MNNIFEFGNLYCSYLLANNGKQNRKPVLHVKDIKIPRDKITFVLGSSGSGKSTFMEAIALMSDTIHSCDDYKSEKLFYYTQQGSGNDVRYRKFNIVTRKFESEDGKSKPVDLDIFRFNNFSFIFQATNLMGNFNALENVAITDYIHDENNAEANAIHRLVEKLEMTDIRRFDKRPNEYSGGQRQRFAFARALGARAKVLFGDEPTGNLDHNNSFILLRILRNLIKENVQLDNDGIRNAILVSHSLELALSFADIIIIIVPPVPKTDDEEENDIVAMGRSNQLLVYDNEKIKWRARDLIDKSDKTFKRVSKEIAFLLNYEFTPINNLFVDIYDKIMEDTVIDKHELDYFSAIKTTFIDSFSYEVTFEEKKPISKEILLAKLDEIEKKLGVAKDYHLSIFVKEKIELNWKQYETPEVHH